MDVSMRCCWYDAWQEGVNRDGEMRFKSMASGEINVLMMNPRAGWIICSIEIVRSSAVSKTTPNMIQVIVQK